MQDKVNEDARLNIMKQSSLRELLEIDSKKKRGELTGKDANTMSRIIVDTLELQEELEDTAGYSRGY